MRRLQISRRVGVTLMALTCLLLTACSYNPFTPAEQIPIISAPGLQRLVALSHLTGNADTGQVLSLLPLLTSSGSSPKVFMTVDGVATSVHLDGSGRATLTPYQGCGVASVTHDDRWAICFDGAGAQMISLDPLHPNQHTTPFTTITTTNPGSIATPTPIYSGNLSLSVFSPVWAPNDQTIAVIQQGGIVLYMTEAPYTTFTPTAYITTPLFANAGLDWLSWSPDGEWLAIDMTHSSPTDAVAGPDQIALLPVRTLPQVVFARQAKPLNVDVPNSAFTMIQGGTNILPTWNMRQQSLTFAYDGRVIQSFSLRTHALTTVLKLPSYAFGILSLAWLLDGKRIIFSDGRDWCADCHVSGRSDVYLFSPPV